MVCREEGGRPPRKGVKKPDEVRIFDPTVSAVTINRKRQLQLNNESLEALRTQWAVGPLKTHRGCSRASTATVRERKRAMGNGPTPMWMLTDARFRCGSNTCRPGDPYGCSMNNARSNEAKSRTMLDGWLRHGGTAYLGLMEHCGARGEQLEKVKQAAKNAFSSAFGGGVWSDTRSRLGIAGQMATLQVAKGSNGGWLLRRWVVLACETDLECELDDLAAGLSARWSRSIGEGTTTDPDVRAAVHLRDVQPEMVRTVTQTITNSFSDFEPAVERWAGALDAEYGLDAQVGERPAEIARRFRENSGGLVSQFREAHRNAYISRQQGGLYFITGREPQKKWVEIDVPDECADFIEYSLDLERVPSWTAYRRGGSTDSAWNALKDQADRVTCRPFEPPQRRQVRRGGKV